MSYDFTSITWGDDVPKIWGGKFHYKEIASFHAQLARQNTLLSKPQNTFLFKKYEGKV